MSDPVDVSALRALAANSAENDFPWVNVEADVLIRLLDRVEALEAERAEVSAKVDALHRQFTDVFAPRVGLTCADCGKPALSLLRGLCIGCQQ